MANKHIENMRKKQGLIHKAPEIPTSVVGAANSPPDVVQKPVAPLPRSAGNLKKPEKPKEPAKTPSKPKKRMFIDNSPKGRLPHMASFVADYDGTREEWAVTLFIEDSSSENGLKEFHNIGSSLEGTQRRVARECWKYLKEKQDEADRLAHRTTLDAAGAGVLAVPLGGAADPEVA